MKVPPKRGTRFAPSKGSRRLAFQVGIVLIIDFNHWHDSRRAEKDLGSNN